MIRYGRKKIRYNHIKGCKNWWETDGVYGTKKSFLIGFQKKNGNKELELSTRNGRNSSITGAELHG